MGLPPEDNSILFCGRNLATTIYMQLVSVLVKCTLVHSASLCHTLDGVRPRGPVEPY